jgi:hypothetical protein
MGPSSNPWPTDFQVKISNGEALSGAIKCGKLHVTCTWSRAGCVVRPSLKGTTMIRKCTCGAYVYIFSHISAHTYIFPHISAEILHSDHRHGFGVSLSLPSQDCLRLAEPGTSMAAPAPHSTLKLAHHTISPTLQGFDAPHWATAACMETTLPPAPPV